MRDITNSDAVKHVKILQRRETEITTVRVRSTGEAEMDFGGTVHVSLPPRGSCGLFASSIISMSPSSRLMSASGFTVAKEPANSKRNLVRENS